MRYDEVPVLTLSERKGVTGLAMGGFQPPCGIGKRCTDAYWRCQCGCRAPACAEFWRLYFTPLRRTTPPTTGPPPTLSGYSKFCVVVLSLWTILRVRTDNQADRPASMEDISTTLNRLLEASPVYPDMESWPTPLQTYPDFLHVSSIRRIS